MADGNLRFIPTRDGSDIHAAYQLLSEETHETFTHLLKTELFPKSASPSRIDSPARSNSGTTPLHHRPLPAVSGAGGNGERERNGERELSPHRLQHLDMIDHLARDLAPPITALISHRLPLHPAHPDPAPRRRALDEETPSPHRHLAVWDCLRLPPRNDCSTSLHQDQLGWQRSVEHQMEGWTI